MEALVGPPPKWYQRIDWENLIERVMLALTTVTVVWLSPMYGSLLALAVVIMVGLVKIAETMAAAYSETHVTGKRDE
jgi:hypothetical protein